MVFLQVSEGVCRAEPVAAVCPGASGVLEYTSRVSPTGAGNCQRPSLCLPCKATDFLFSFAFFFTCIDPEIHALASNSAKLVDIYADLH